MTTRHANELFSVRVATELPRFNRRKMTEFSGKKHYFCRLFAHNCSKKRSNREIFVDDSRNCFSESLNSELGPDIPILPFHIKLTPPFGVLSRM